MKRGGGGGPAKSMTTNSEYEEIMAELNALRGHSATRAVGGSDTAPALEGETQTTPRYVHPSPLIDATNTQAMQNGELQAEGGKGVAEHSVPRFLAGDGEASWGPSKGANVGKLQDSMERCRHSHPMEGALAGSSDLPEEIQHALVKYQRAKKLLSHQIQESEKMGELLSKERSTNAELRLRLDTKITVCEEAVKEGLSAIQERVKHDKEHMEHLKQGLGLSEMGKMAAVKELHKCQCELKETKGMLADLEVVKENLLVSVEDKRKELVNKAKEDAVAMESRIRKELLAEFNAKEDRAVKEAQGEADKLRRDLCFIQESIRIHVFGVLEGLQNEASGVQETVNQWNQWVSDITHELSTTREERMKCEAECQRLKKEVKDHKRECSQMDIMSLKNEATMLLIEKTHLMGENAKLQQRMSILESTNAHIESCWKESREQFSMAETKFLMLKKCLEELSDANPSTDAIRELNDAREKLTAVTKERDDVVISLQQSRERESSLDSCVQELEEEVKNLTMVGRAELSALTRRLEMADMDAKEQKAVLEAKCESLEAALTFERRQHEGGSSGMQNALQDCMRDLQAASQELNSVQQGLGTVLPTTETVKEIASNVIQQAEAVTQHLQSELAASLHNFEEVDQNLTLKKLECRNLEARLTEAHRKLRLQDEIIIRQNEELMKMKDEVHMGVDLAHEVVSMREKCEMLKGTVKRLDREILEEREEVLMLCRANTKLQSNLVDANNVLQETKDKLACLERQRAQDDLLSESGSHPTSGGCMTNMQSGSLAIGFGKQGRVPGMIGSVGSLEATTSESDLQSDEASTNASQPGCDDNHRAPLVDSGNDQPGTSQRAWHSGKAGCQRKNR